MKAWYICPICGQKLCMIDDCKDIEGVYLKCKKCKSEIEIKNSCKNVDNGQLGQMGNAEKEILDELDKALKKIHKENKLKKDKTSGKANDLIENDIDVIRKLNKIKEDAKSLNKSTMDNTLQEVLEV